MFINKLFTSGAFEPVSEVAFSLVLNDTRPSRRMATREAKPTIPNPPTCISNAITTCPNKLQCVSVSIVVRPVTVVADVAVNNESKKEVAWPLFDAIGSDRSAVPKRMMAVKAIDMI
jgi:hypothetical protein